MGDETRIGYAQTLLNDHIDQPGRDQDFCDPAGDRRFVCRTGSRVRTGQGLRARQANFCFFKILQAERAADLLSKPAKRAR